MHFEGRLWQFTAGVRGRIAGSAAIGLLAAALGVVRLALSVSYTHLTLPTTFGV